MLPDGTMEGFVGGVCAESTTRAEALRLLGTAEPGMLRITPGGGPDDLASGLHVVENPCLSGARVSAPAGLDIGARTPPEIAVSVYAEMVGSEVRPGRRIPEVSTGSATDPVCGMAVARVPASLRAEHAGAVVWFCGPACRDAFVADAGRYAHG